MLDEMLRNLVHGELSIGKRKIAFLDILLIVGTTVAGLMIRQAIFGISGNPVISGGTKMLAYCGLDLVLAALMAWFVWITTKNTLKTVGIYALTVLWPAIAGNSALNGGSEVFYAVLLLALLCVIFRRQHVGKGSFWSVTAAVCAVQIIEADPYGEKLTNFWPNIYTLYSETGFVQEYGISGKLLVFGILLMIFYYLSKKKFEVTPKILLASGLFFSLFISTFYPFMNYRSGFFANVFGILLFFFDKKKFYVPMAMCIISYTSYGYAYGSDIEVVRWIYALALIGLMLDAGVYLYKQVKAGRKNEADKAELH